MERSPYRPEIEDTPENIKMQKAIKERADWSLAVLGMSFVTRGSGRFVHIRAADRPYHDYSTRR